MAIRGQREKRGNLRVNMMVSSKYTNSCCAGNLFSLRSFLLLGTRALCFHVFWFLWSFLVIREDIYYWVWKENLDFIKNNLRKWVSTTHVAFLGGNVFMLTFYFPFHSVQDHEYLDVIQFNLKVHLLDYFQISNLTPVISNFSSSECSTTWFHCLFSCHDCRDRPLTRRGRANCSVCASNWKAAVEFSNLWFSECSLSKLRGKNDTQYRWEEKNRFFFACLRVQTRSELPFGHTVDCEISAKKSQF